LLIGAEWFYNIHHNQLKIYESLPPLQEMVFGWVVGGLIPDRDEDLKEEFKKFQKKTGSENIWPIHRDFAGKAKFGKFRRNRVTWSFDICMPWNGTEPSREIHAPCIKEYFLVHHSVAKSERQHDEIESFWKSFNRNFRKSFGQKCSKTVSGKVSHSVLETHMRRETTVATRLVIEQMCH
jgi:hypothetical protein